MNLTNTSTLRKYHNHFPNCIIAQDDDRTRNGRAVLINDNVNLAFPHSLAHSSGTTPSKFLYCATEFRNGRTFLLCLDFSEQTKKSKVEAQRMDDFLFLNV